MDTPGAGVTSTTADAGADAMGGPAGGVALAVAGSTIVSASMSA